VTTLLLLVVVVSTSVVSSVLFMRSTRSWRQLTAELTTELVCLQRVNDALLQRLAALQPCEVCGRPLAEGDSAMVRLGPDGYDVVAHGLCLGPMPGQRQGY
jgi:hypothetical protein